VAITVERALGVALDLRLCYRVYAEQQARVGWNPQIKYTLSALLDSLIMRPVTQSHGYWHTSQPLPLNSVI
jgi:hypothetical protein